jgi:hypothetical protein
MRKHVFSVLELKNPLEYTVTICVEEAVLPGDIPPDEEIVEDEAKELLAAEGFTPCGDYGTLWAVKDQEMTKDQIREKMLSLGFIENRIHGDFMQSLVTAMEITLGKIGGKSRGTMQEEYE